MMVLVLEIVKNSFFEYQSWTDYTIGVISIDRLIDFQIV